MGYLIMTRINRLREKLNENQGIIISNPANAFYLSEIKSSNITLYITKNKTFLFTDFRYKEIAEQNKQGFETITDKNILNCDFLGEEPEILLETDYITYDCYKKLAERYNKIKLIPADNLVTNLRLIKSEAEISNIKRACEIAENAYLKTLPDIKEGMTELSLKALLQYNMLFTPSFDTIVLFGEASSVPHGESSDRKLKLGDTILMDFGCFYNGYASDMTRTIFFGQPSSAQKKAYTTVLSAHERAVEFIAGNKKCSEIDKEARDYIDNSGYKGLFGHSLGHGLGIDIHEAPRLTTKTDDVLNENMIFTIEPGIYIEKNFGIRIENTYVLSENTAKSLMNVEKSLTIL